MSDKRVAVIDYGMGNLKSVSHPITALESRHEIIADPGRVADFDKVIIPGVGAFAEASESLRKSGMFDALHDHVESGKCLLGICLGMQLLCKESMENGQHLGFGWIDAQVLCFPESMLMKVPHMGWNSLKIARQNALVSGVNSGADVYFVHSYFASCGDQNDVLAYTEYGINFASIIGRENVFGVQSSVAVESCKASDSSTRTRFIMIPCMLSNRLANGPWMK